MIYKKFITFIDGKSSLLAPQLLRLSNFNPQLQNRLVLVPELAKLFTFSIWIG